jgi:dTDP-4-amino-4,6-dideoxygalactose transaminase
MNEISAALGLVQLKRLPDFLHERAHHYADLAAGLRDIEGVSLLATSHGRFQSSYYCQSLVLGACWAGRRDDIILRLRSEGVGTSIYYPQPVPLMSYYQRQYGRTAADFPVAARLSWQSIALPVGPHLDADDIRYMIATIRRVLADKR